MSTVEINKKALAANLKTLRKTIGQQVILAPCVKANAYGHGLLQTSKIALQSGADWLCVNALFEAKALRKANIKSPLYILVYVMNEDLEEVLRLSCRIVVYNKETIRNLAKASRKTGKRATVHIKVETGNNRQGILPDDVLDFVKFAKKFHGIEIEGIATHFANIEDISPVSPHRHYPQKQLEGFKKIIENLRKNGVRIPLQHCANSAATLLYPETHFNMVRPGIALYGLWPSEEVKIAVKKKNPDVELVPVLSWKTRIAQIKTVGKNSYIGYGCTYHAKRKMRLAILPVGYYDGYDRRLSNKAHVLIHGKRAAVCGRVCMNIIMVDVTNIPQARVEDPVTLLGKEGREEISAEYLAELAGTINYEITTRICEGIPRVVTTS